MRLFSQNILQVKYSQVLNFSVKLTIHFDCSIFCEKGPWARILIKL